MNCLKCLVFILLIPSLAALSQEKSADTIAPFNRYKHTEFHLVPLRNKESLPFPVSSIEIADVRQDTTKFGYVFGGVLGTAYRQFCSEDNPDVEIARFFNNSFAMVSPAPGQKLLYCLKKLWVAVIDTASNKQDGGADMKGSRLYLEAELFFEKEGICYPVYRFDSIFIYRDKPTVTSSRWIENALAVSLGRLKDNNPEKVVKRASLRRAEIGGYYSDQKQTAIASATTPVKGVYLNVEQFKNNRPAFTDYEISFDKIADIMRVKDKDGNAVIITKDWGFCDGEKFFIRMGLNYFRLFKKGDTYELNGTTAIAKPASTAPTYMPGYGYTGGGEPLSFRKKEFSLADLRPLQIDMETGKIY